MKKILIFDDEKDILEIAELILKKDFEIHTRNNLEDPVKVVMQLQPDLILLDLFIPPIGGSKAVQLLKENKNTEHVKIIMFSASYDLPEISQRCGADGYLIKPFKVNQLKNFLKDQLKDEPAKNEH